MKIRKCITALLVLLLTACVSNPPVGSSSLKELQASKPSEFNYEEPFAEKCGELPTPVVSLTLNSFYTDTASSVIDKSKRAKLEQDIKPIEDWTLKLNTNSTNHLRLKGQKSIDAGKCAVAFLDYWARGDALLGEMKGDSQSHAFQKWGFGQAAATYFKVRDVATPDQDVRIKWWLNKLTVPVKAYWDNPSHTRNNHLAFAGAAIMQYGVLTSDKESIEWARRVFNEEINQVTAEGALPLEVKRRQLALQYQNFAIQPLVYMAELSRMIGEDWWTNEKLQRAITFTINANLDPTRMEKLAGTKQSHSTSIEWAWNWGWVANLPSSDPRRTKMMAMTEVPKGYWFMSSFLGEQETFRNLVENNRKN